MYLSRLQLDTSCRRTMKALAEPKLFHGALENAFPGERKRRLWRVDTLGGKRYLLLLSDEAADLSAVAGQFCASKDAWEQKDYAPFLAHVEQGTVWHFRLTANPTKSCPTEDRQADLRGRVHAHITAEYQEKWLMDRAEKHGFSLKSGEFRTVGSAWKLFRKGTEQGRVTLLAVTYEGLLTVTDAELFRKTLTEGIGRGKAYGMGLMTIVRPMGS